MEKLPPVEKIYEAYTAIVDGRVIMQEDRATVLSSGKEKEYTVTWKGNIYTSTDSATYWQGYAGYPVIAVLMLQGRLPFDVDIAQRFKGVNWAALNKMHKRDYEKAAEEVFESMKAEEKAKAKQEVQRVHVKIKELDVMVRRGKKSR